jgi:hypothetical protein
MIISKINSSIKLKSIKKIVLINSIFLISSNAKKLSIDKSSIISKTYKNNTNITNLSPNNTENDVKAKTAKSHKDIFNSRLPNSWNNNKPTSARVSVKNLMN